MDVICGFAVAYVLVDVALSVYVARRAGVSFSDLRLSNLRGSVNRSQT
jgi:hypothetical protein